MRIYCVLTNVESGVECELTLNVICLLYVCVNVMYMWTKDLAVNKCLKLKYRGE